MTSERKQFSAEIHKRAIKKFTRRKVIVNSIDDIWAMDLADLNSLISYNNEYRCMLCIVDVFSKFAWAVSLKDKTAETVLSAVQGVVKKIKKTPKKFWVDQGSEFYNKKFQAWIKDKNITMLLNSRREQISRC